MVVGCDPYDPDQDAAADTLRSRLPWLPVESTLSGIATAALIQLITGRATTDAQIVAGLDGNTTQK